MSIRKKHRCIRKNTQPISLGFNNITFHHGVPWNDTLGTEDHVIGIMYSGKKKDGSDDAVFLAMNTYWENVDITLPELLGYGWKARVYTGVPFSRSVDPSEAMNRRGNTVTLCPRSAAVFVIE